MELIDLLTKLEAAFSLFDSMLRFLIDLFFEFSGKSEVQKQKFKTKISELFLKEQRNIEEYFCSKNSRK